MAKRLDLLLINPGGAKRQVYQEMSDGLSAVEPPFWAALTAGYLRKEGFNVEIIDANAENLSFAETAEQIEYHNPKLVNVVVYGQHPSASTQLMTSVGNLCTNIKGLNSSRRILLSGLHPSALPERTLREENCDFVCEGEGFYTLKGLLSGTDLIETPGLWWRENGNPVHTERAANVQNLAGTLGDPAWDLLPSLEIYKAHNWQCLGNLDQRNFYVSLSTSLGCPNRCDFCSIHKTYGEHRTRFWSPEWVIRQIDYLVNKKGLRNLKIIDEEFTINPGHFMAIANELIERNYGLNTWAYTRINNVPDEMQLNSLKDSGFNWLCPGIESADEAVRRDVSKRGYHDDDIVVQVRKMQSAGINVLGNFMFGLPGDNFGTMQRTLALAMDLNCEFANFYCTIAWPGSELYDRITKQNIAVPEIWQDYAQHSRGFIPLPTKYLSPRDVLEFRDNAFHQYFTNPKYLKMVEHKFGQRALNHINNMTKIQLKRNILENER